MNLETVRTSIAKRSDSDLRAFLNSMQVHADLRTFEGLALEGLRELVAAACEEWQSRKALRAMYATGGCD